MKKRYYQQPRRSPQPSGPLLNTSPPHHLCIPHHSWSHSWLLTLQSSFCCYITLHMNGRTIFLNNLKIKTNRKRSIANRCTIYVTAVLPDDLTANWSCITFILKSSKYITCFMIEGHCWLRILLIFFDSHWYLVL